MNITRSGGGSNHALFSNNLIQGGNQHQCIYPTLNNNSENAAKTPENPDTPIGGLYPGLFIDVRDTVDKWCEGEVLEVDSVRRRVYITYTYWSDKFNEWLPVDSERIAPFAMHTYHGNPANLKVVGVMVVIQ